MPENIGSVFELKSPIVAAPMAGVTDYPFRQILREYGAELCFTEMVSSHGLVQGNQRTMDLLDFERQGGKIGVQIFGAETEVMVEAAGIIETEISPDIIDINMGCPAPKVTKGGAGAALMKRPARAFEIARSVTSAVDIPVTVKMRKGWRREDESCLELTDRLAAAGVSAVTIHGRSREEFYQGEADWQVINRAADKEIFVIGNGDIFAPEDAGEMLEQTGCDGVMLARGLKGNPWLMERSREFLEKGRCSSPPSPQEKILQAMEHLELACDYYGEERAVPIMRKHISWYLKGLPYCTEVREKVNRIEDRTGVEEELTSYLNKFTAE